jgi:hypothetical protein
VEADTWPEIRAAGLPVRPCDISQGSFMSVGGLRNEELAADPQVWKAGVLMEAIESWDGPDVTAGELLARHGLTGNGRTLGDMTLTLHPAGDLDEIGIAGLRHDRVVELERGLNHRVDSGYDRLVGWVAGDLPVRLGRRVESIAWGDGVTVRCAGGEEVRARGGVCTLPVGVLKSGAVRFEPGLPETKRRALDGLEMGAVLKILMRFRRAFWPEHAPMIICDGPIRLYWPPLLGVSGAPAVLTAYVTGHRAKALSVVSEQEAIGVALDDLARIFPDANPHGDLEASRRIDWITDENSRGGYSFVRVGGGGARRALAAPDTGALLWAGDATATTTIASVVHAAYATGIRAGRAAAERLGAVRPS